MFGIKNKLDTWKLQSRLLVPLSLVLAAAIGQSIFINISTTRQTELLLERRGKTVLAGIAKSVEERQHTKEIIVELLVNDKNLPLAVKRKDKVALARILGSRQAKLELGNIQIYTVNNQEILHLGEQTKHAIAAPLVKSALSGLTRSAIGVSDRGLSVLASAPIRENQKIVGAILVSSRLNGSFLEEFKKENGVELALFHEGKSIDTTINKAKVRHLLDRYTLGSNTLSLLDRDITKYKFHFTAKPISNNGIIVALVPTEDLLLETRERNAIVLISSLLLLSTLLWLFLVLAQDIAKPLKSMVSATGDIVRGNYHRRVLPCKIPELNELAKAINYLAQQLEIQLAELSWRAFHDPLTNLPNRALFLNQLEQVLLTLGKQQSSLAVLFLDLDGFKVINDSLGHKAGDELLIAVSQRLKSCLRSTDIVARLGGDEFIILVKEISNQTEVTSVAERIIEQLQTPFTIQGREVFISSSIGITLNTSGYERSDDLMRNADAAMYDAKKRGKSRYAIFQPDMDSRAFERLQLATDLRRAIEREEFRLYYQPVVQLDNGKIVEVEALVRWEHPRIGLISPSKFIPLAEETGLILPIGEWVLRTACQQARSWQLQHPSDPLIVGVNLSPKQFQQPQLVETIAQILDETNLSPRHLKLEITESMMMEQGDTTISTLLRLKNLGIRLAIDDFGTGFSALSYLKRFPVDTLKIDGSFIKGLGHNREDTAIVHAVIAFAKALHLSVTAEVVESAEQLAQLRLVGCDRAQGYYFSEPIAADAVKQLIDAHLDRSLHIQTTNSNGILHTGWATA